MSSKTSLVELALSRWRPIKEKRRAPFFSKCRNSGNNGRNCTIFGAQGDLGCPFNSPYFDLGVTSRDLYMTLTVFKTRGPTASAESLQKFANNNLGRINI